MDNYNKFSNILNIKEKQKILFLLILMIFSASLEVLGIGMVIPIITLRQSKGRASLKVSRA